MDLVRSQSKRGPFEAGELQVKRRAVAPLAEEAGDARVAERGGGRKRGLRQANRKACSGCRKRRHFEVVFRTSCQGNEWEENEPKVLTRVFRSFLEF